ncbi:MAG TPA: MATE family efflux transporter [Candidatus Polarisedimenticolia bacterium]|nr:MATE family efflux transporter [Candidatus Polarisedimenticolia bacterium]
MSAPIVVSFWMRSLFTFVDTAYAATLGDAAVAAVGLTIPFEFLMIAFWVGVSTGLTSHLSQAMGARQGARIEQLLRAARTIVWILVPIFTAIGVGSWFLAPHLGLPDEVARMFAIYSLVLIGGSAFTSFWSIIPDSIVKAHHDTRATMWAGIWSNLINVVLNTLFTFVFHWGVFGIAFSTVVGRFGGLAYALGKAAKHENNRKAGGLDTDPGLDPTPYRSILALAVPAALTYALMALEASVVNRLLATGADATSSIAAYGIYYRVWQFAFMPIIAASVAVLPFVARLSGERDFAAVRRGLRQAMLAGAAYCVLFVAPAVALGGGALARALAESETTARLTHIALWLVPFAALAAVPFQLCRPAFEGLQRGRPGLVMAMVRYVGLTAPFGFGGMVLGERFGFPALFGLLAGLIGASLLASSIFLVWMRKALGALERGGAQAAIRPTSAPDPAPAP